MASILKNIPLSPAVTGGLLFALTRAPTRYRDALLQALQQYLSPTSIARGITALKWLFALGLARNLHVFLSDIAQNNFRLRSEKHRYVWHEEIAVVTGGASGFGALISQALAEKSINVMAVDIKDELPAHLKSHTKIHYYKCDISNRQAVLDLAQQIREEHGDASILVNNAGVAWTHSVLEASERAIQNTFDVNILSHYWTLQAFLPAMIAKHKGHIVSTASMASFVNAPGLVPYCSTKAAVLSLHEGMQLEARMVHKAPEIKFTIVHPTYAATPLAQPFLDDVRASGFFVLDPKVVSDAVVAQILACRGKQIILAGGQEFVGSVRGWPHWLAQPLLRSGERKIPWVEALLSKERTSSQM